MIVGSADTDPRAMGGVAIRAAEPDDAPLLARWRTESSVRRHQPLSPRTPRQLRDELSTRDHGAIYEGRGSRFDWIVVADEIPVGWITVVVQSWDHGIGELGYALTTEAQGHGVMTRALGLLLDKLFDRTDLYRIEARCAVANQPSRRVLEKLGFRHEGTLRGYFELDGERVDNRLYAMLKTDA